MFVPKPNQAWRVKQIQFLKAQISYVVMLMVCVILEGMDKQYILLFNVENKTYCQGIN